MSMKQQAADQARGQKPRTGKNQEMHYPQKGKNDRINSRVHGYSCIWCWPYEVRDIRLAELMTQGVVR